MEKLNQSASKPLSLIKYGEGSQTIANGEYASTNEVEKGSTLTHNGEGEDIVETKNKTFFEKSVEKHGNKYDYTLVNYKRKS